MRVLILGCGPAGLIAAHAAKTFGADIAILSKKRPSHMKGAQYLHRPISGIDCGDPFQIDYQLKGSPMGYRMKVYGPKYMGTVSPEDLAEPHSGWDIRRAYDALWDLYGHAVTDWQASPIGLKSMLDHYAPSVTISTVPAPTLCSQNHSFLATNVFSTDSLSSVGIYMPENTVVCNGEEAPRWYRAARIKGWETIEWPGDSKPPITPLWSVPKPTDNNCDCFPQVIRGGRYGVWRKGVLSHEIYDETLKALQNYMEGIK